MMLVSSKLASLVLQVAAHPMLPCHHIAEWPARGVVQTCWCRSDSVLAVAGAVAGAVGRCISAAKELVAPDALTLRPRLAVNLLRAGEERMGKWKEGALKRPGSDSVCGGPANIRRIGWNGEWQPVGRCIALQELRRCGLYGCTKHTTDARYHKAGNGEEPIQEFGTQLGKGIEWSRTVGRFVAEAPGYGRYRGCGRGC